MPEEWKLCGSRWYGDADENSDFDYVREASDEPENWLKANGFEEAFTYGSSEEKGRSEKQKINCDSNTATVFVNAPESIHAILCFDLKLRLRAREIAKTVGLPKECRKRVEVWNAIYRALNETPKTDPQ